MHREENVTVQSFVQYNSRASQPILNRYQQVKGFNGSHLLYVIVGASHPDRVTDVFNNS